MAMVKIACKLPHGIWLEIVDPADDKTPLNVKPTGPRVRLRGANDQSVYSGTNPAVPAFAFTMVDKSFWDKWISNPGNKEFVWMRNGSVFEVPEQPKEMAAKAKEHATELTGFEPLKPNADGKFNDSRMPLRVAADQEQMERLARREVVA